MALYSTYAVEAAQGKQQWLIILLFIRLSPGTYILSMSIDLPHEFPIFSLLIHSLYIRFFFFLSGHSLCCSCSRASSPCHCLSFCSCWSGLLFFNLKYFFPPSHFYLWSNCSVCAGSSPDSRASWLRGFDVGMYLGFFFNCSRCFVDG